ncbi:MAG: hypothetical protein C0618_02415 [Desulfuromonas sp.]|nr:MAG: hypothetical protein C0618_02415 [Desulfuromonas sp.]
MTKSARKRQMGDLLVEAGVLKRVNLADALARQKVSKKKLGEILQEMGVVCDKDIALVLATQFNIRPVPPLADQPRDPQLRELVDIHTAIQRLVYPISRNNRRLNLAMANPLDLEIVDRIAFSTSLDVVPWVATPSEILAGIRYHYLESTQNAPESMGTIVLVEDKEKIRLSSALALRREGYRVVEASSAKMGLAAVLKHEPQLIITETVMVGMDGREMFRVLRKNPDTRSIPVIGFSSKATRDEEVSLLNMGFADFISKPINLELLIARVARVFALVYRGEHTGRQGAPVLSPLHGEVEALLDLMQVSQNQVRR